MDNLEERKRLRPAAVLLVLAVVCFAATALLTTLTDTHGPFAWVWSLFGIALLVSAMEDQWGET